MRAGRGLAMHNYHDVHGELPIASSLFNQGDWGTARGTQFVMMLPYFDQAPLYNSINFNVTGDIGNQDINGRLLRLHDPPPVLLCPSDDTAKILDGTWSASNYAFSLGAQAMDSQNGSCTSYPPPWPGPGPDPYPQRMLQGNWGHGNNVDPARISGLVSRLGWSAKFRDVKDGLSNTIALGEIRPNCIDHRGGWVHTNSLWIATTGPINFETCPTQPGYVDDASMGCNWHRNWQTSLGFKSSHTGGAQFVFADGSVHFLSENIDYLTYQFLGDRRDGNSVSF